MKGPSDQVVGASGGLTHGSLFRPASAFLGLDWLLFSAAVSSAVSLLKFTIMASHTLSPLSLWIPLRLISYIHIVPQGYWTCSVLFAWCPLSWETSSPPSIFFQILSWKTTKYLLSEASPEQRFKKFLLHPTPSGTPLLFLAPLFSSLWDYNCYNPHFTVSWRLLLKITELGNKKPTPCRIIPEFVL